MKTDFEKLPIKIQASITIRNDCIDALVDSVMDLEKADFLAQRIQEDYTQEIDNEESLNRWKYEKPRISLLVDMIRDYTIKARECLQALDTKLSESNKTDRGGA